MLEGVDYEGDEGIRDLLNAFRSKLADGRLVRYWNDETELCYRLLSSLATTSRKYPGDGWFRGGKESPEVLLRRILTLEEENRILQKDLAEWRNMTIPDHPPTFLNNTVNIKYGITQDDGGG